MRIIAGRLGGRSFETPRSRRTHPMSDRVRGALFNSLGDIKGLTILDAFAGTGAAGFEGLSRGAASVLFIEIDRPAQQSITASIQQLGLRNNAKLVKANCSGWSDNNPTVLFDIILAAPPYTDLQLSIVRKLTRHLNPNGIFIVDWPGKQDAPELDGLRIVEQKNYGDAQLVFYQWST